MQKLIDRESKLKELAKKAYEEQLLDYEITDLNICVVYLEAQKKHLRLSERCGDCSGTRPGCMHYSPIGGDSLEAFLVINSER